MSAFEAFATAFLNKTASQIDARKQEGRDYFSRQMDRAQTVGRDALRARKANLAGLTTTANTLTTQAGMPEDILRVLVNEGPDALKEAQKISEIAASNGQRLDEEFWRGVVKFSGDVKPGDQPLSEFLAQSVGLFDSNLQATAPKGGDPFSAFVGAGLGYNAMDVARQKLESEAVEGGYSASDLLAMEGGPAMESVLGPLGATIDQGRAAESLNRFATPPANPFEMERTQEQPQEPYEVSPDVDAAPDFRGSSVDAQPVQAPAGMDELPQQAQDVPVRPPVKAAPVTAAMKLSIDKTFNEKLKEAAYSAGSTVATEEVKAQVAQEMVELLGMGVASQIPSIAKYLSKQTPTPAVAPQPAPAAPVPTPQAGETMVISGIEVTATGKVDEAGDPIFRLPDGREVAARVPDPVSVDGPVDPLPEAPTAMPEPQAEEEPFITLAPGEEPPATKVIDGKTLTFFGKTMVGNVNFVTYQDEQGNRTSIPVKESR